MTTKIPVELSSTPGIVDGSNATAITIDSSERVGINNSVMSSMDNGKNNLVVGSGSGGQGMTIYSANNAFGTIAFADGTSGDDKYRGLVTYSHSADSLDFYTNATEKMTILTDGKVGIGTTSPLTKFHVHNGSDAENILIVTGADTTTEYISLGTSSGVGVLKSGNSAAGATSLAFETAASNGAETERMRINSSGIFGMGSSPSNVTSEILTITTPSSGGGQGLAFKRLDTNSDQSVGQIRWSNNSTDDLAFIKVKTDGANTAGAMQFFTNVGDGVAEKMRINKSGQLLLKTTSNNSDTYKMVVNCDSGSKGIDVRNVSYNSDNGAFRSVPPGNTSYRFAVMLNSSNSTVGKIEVTSNSTTYTTSSDYRLKENITTLENGIDRLNKLKPVKFNWIESGQEEEGFIAHEVDEIFSDAVTGEKDAVQDNGTVSPQTMDYGRITPLLVKAIQEQQEQIEQLKTEIQTLKGE